MLPYDLLHQAVLTKHDVLAQDEEAKYEGELEINKLIFVEKCLEDELTIENLCEKSLPAMVQNEQDLPFSVEKSQYDNQKSVKMRVISKNDWGRVDWKTGKLININAEPVTVDRIIINIHGGSWMSGHSAKDLPITSKIVQESGCTMFAIDYRLAPSHKFPHGLSDCFQMYLWLTYYSEKYLQLKFKEIIIEGDSAGGNISCGVVAQIIMKGVKVPHGISLIYPCSSTDRDSFCPSLLIGIDDVQLNYWYMPLVLTIYTTHEQEKNPISCVKKLDDEILSKFPTVKIIISEVDALRDEVLRFVTRLLKNGVKVEATIFRHQTHGFLGHADFPEERDMMKNGIQQLVENTK